MSAPICHICVLTGPGTGHMRPTIALAHYYLKDPQISAQVTLVLPVRRDRKPTLIVQDDSMKVVLIEIPDHIDHLLLREYLDDNKEAVASEVIRKLIEAHSPPITAIVCEMFSVMWGHLVSRTLGIQHYLFCPSPLSFLWYSQHHRTITQLRRDGKETSSLSIPGWDHPFNLTDFANGPASVMDRIYLYMDTFASADGYICHDVPPIYGNERELTQAVTENDTRARERLNLPPRELRIFYTGALCLHAIPEKTNAILPTLFPANQNGLEWLNFRKPNSVIYVALGSWCTIEDRDVHELAHALEKCGHNFLWGYRPKSKEIDDLPIHFREKFGTGTGRGFVCDWVDQIEALKSPAISLFITHCGWNSLLEGMALGGKPLLLLPVAAEQGVNAVVVQEQFRIGHRLWNMRSERALNRDEIVSRINSILKDNELGQRATLLKNQIWDYSLQGKAVLHRTEFLETILSNKC